MGKQCKQWRIYFLGSKITADGDCSHEIKRLLLLGRKAVTDVDSILKTRDITLPTKAHLVRAMVFPVVMYGCESWTVKNAECRSLMLLNCGVGEDSWRRSNQSILKEISPEYSLEGLMLKLKLHTLATWCEKLTLWKRPWCWEGLGAGGEGDDRGWDGWMASLTQWTWVGADSGREGRTRKTACFSPWGCTESNVTVSEEQRRAQMMGYGACPTFFNYMHPLSVRITFWLWSASGALLLCYITFYFWKSNSLQSDRAP